MADITFTPQMLALVNRYSDIYYLRNSLVEPHAFAMINPHARPFPYAFDGCIGYDCNAGGVLWLQNQFDVIFGEKSGSRLYVNKCTPGCVKQILSLWLDQTNYGDSNAFQSSVLQFRHKRLASVEPKKGPEYNFAENEELYIYHFNFCMEFTRAVPPPIMSAIVLNWARRCCGVIRDGDVLSDKLESAVLDVMMQMCPKTARRQFGNDLDRARKGFPQQVLYGMCRAADRYIKHVHGKETWWFPNDEGMDPSEFHEYVNQQAILHVSNVPVYPGTRWIDSCIWVIDQTGYPLAPGDVRTLIREDTSEPDPTKYSMKDLDPNHPVVLEAAQCYIAYKALWNLDPLDQAAAI